MKNATLLVVAIVLLSRHWASAQPSNLSVTPTTLSVSVGATATIRVTASGASPFTYQWWFTNAVGSNPIDGVANPSALRNTLNLTNVQVSAAGGYYAVVTDTNSLSATSGVANLEVDPTFTKITQGPIVNDPNTGNYGYWGDYDNDGRLDFLLNGDSGRWRLYHNNGGTDFSIVTNGAIGQYQGINYGIWGDPDNDGDLDFSPGLQSEAPPITMFWNDGLGNFTSLPLAGAPNRGFLCEWADFDQDGFLDAFLGDYIGGPNSLLLNNRDGTFTRVTNSILNIPGDTIQVTCAPDYDNDGDLDLVLVRYEGRRTQFYRNDGHGVFTEATPEPIRSELTYSLSSAWGDFDNDGDLDVIFGGWNNLKEHFYINNGDGTFTRWAGQPALFEPYGTTSLGSWLAWGDYDNDGDLDLAVAKGSTPLLRLWRNRGDGSFEQILAGSLVNESGTYIQCGTWVDFNQDGNLDLFLATGQNQNNKLFMGNGNGNHWLEVKLKGTASNRLAVGARVFATATIGGKFVRQMRVITASDSDESLIAHFGLGNAQEATVFVEWPSGISQLEAENSRDIIDRLLLITEWRRPVLRITSVDPVRGTIVGDPHMHYGIEASPDLSQWFRGPEVHTDNTGTAEWSYEPTAGSKCWYFRAIRDPWWG